MSTVYSKSAILELIKKRKEDVKTVDERLKKENEPKKAAYDSALATYNDAMKEWRQKVTAKVKEFNETRRKDIRNCGFFKKRELLRNNKFRSLQQLLDLDWIVCDKYGSYVRNSRIEDGCGHTVEWASLQWTDFEAENMQKPSGPEQIYLSHLQMCDIYGTILSPKDTLDAIEEIVNARSQDEFVDDSEINKIVSILVVIHKDIKLRKYEPKCQ